MKTIITAEWIRGEGIDGVEYITHNQTPFFMAKICAPCDVDEDKLLGIVVNTGVNAFYDIIWAHDDPIVHDPIELLELFSQADEALEEIAAATARRPQPNPDERMACGPWIDEFGLEDTLN